MELSARIRACAKYVPLICRYRCSTSNICLRLAIISVVVVALLQLFYVDVLFYSYYTVCAFSYANFRVIKPATNITGELEFPRLYQIPPCDYSKNASVPKGVCKNLARVFPEAHRQTLLRLLKYFDTMATAHHWTYFMCFGTLWGSWRHHDLIPWDHDLDVYIEYKHRKDIVVQIEALQERFVPKQGIYSKVHLHDKEYITETKYLSGIGRWYEPSIDMFFFVRNSTHIHQIGNNNSFVFKLEELFPLHRRPLANLKIPAPHDPLKFLVDSYSATDECGKHGGPKCEEYKQYLPFVHRKWKNGKMEESLTLDGVVLDVHTVDEMNINMPNNAYTLATSRFPQE